MMIDTKGCLGILALAGLALFAIYSMATVILGWLA